MLVARAREEKPIAFKRTFEALVCLEEWDTITCKGVFAALLDFELDVEDMSDIEMLAARLVFADELTSKGSMEVADRVLERVIHRFKYLAGVNSAASKPGLPWVNDALESACVTTWYRTINDLVAFTLAELEAMRGKQADEYPYTGALMEHPMP